MGPGEHQSSTKQRDQYVGETSSIQFIDPLIVLWVLEGKCLTLDLDRVWCFSPQIHTDERLKFVPH